MIDKISNDFIDILIQYFSNEENNKKIKSTIIDPMIIYIFDKFYPYLLLTGGIIVFIFLLVLSIFILIIRSILN
tara:strand:+ start:382 stop:603 length:222 start_codon:yes stop_codon:yes gene_type:complete